MDLKILNTVDPSLHLNMVAQLHFLHAYPMYLAVPYCEYGTRIVVIMITEAPTIDFPFQGSFRWGNSAKGSL